MLICVKGKVSGVMLKADDVNQQFVLLNQCYPAYLNFHGYFQLLEKPNGYEVIRVVRI
jgi:hypothetical protein